MTQPNSLVREGIISGLLGAAGVALWFLVVDIWVGEPFYTPRMLGEMVLSLFGRASADDTLALHVGLYTVVHVAAFVLIGIIAATIVRVGERESSVLAGATILFVVLQVLFYGLTALLAEPELLGRLAWYQVGIANLIAAALMLAYLWRRHPSIGRRLSHSLSGGENPSRAGSQP